jgi:hypothetical protein
MGVHPHPDGSPEIVVLVSEAAGGVDVVLELKELGRSSILLPGHIVVQLHGERGVWLVSRPP